MVGKCVPIRLCCLLPAACCRIVFFMKLPFGEDALVRLHRRGCPLVGLPWWGIVFPLDCA